MYSLPFMRDKYVGEIPLGLAAVRLQKCLLRGIHIIESLPVKNYHASC